MRGKQASNTTAGELPASHLAAVAAGGAIGSAARYLAGLGFRSPGAPAFPWSTFTINLTGSLLLGLVMVYLLEVQPHRPGFRLFLTTGVLGGYTTFSAYSAGIMHLIQVHALALADAYALTSLVGGVGAVWCGMALGKRLAGRRTPQRQARRERHPYPLELAHAPAGTDAAGAWDATA